jgi:hypothetical protein
MLDPGKWTDSLDLEMFLSFISESTKPLWKRYFKENDPYKQVVILEKIVQPPCTPTKEDIDSL